MAKGRVLGLTASLIVVCAVAANIDKNEEETTTTISTEVVRSTETTEEASPQDAVITEEITEVTEERVICEYDELIKLAGFDLGAVEEYSGNPFVQINNNEPFFADKLIKAEYFTNYSSLDELGRCDTAFAVIGKENLPEEERGEIGNIKPSGWQTVKYPDIIEDLYLYNRCHLIAFCLSGENANELNLITGTRYMNVEGMLPFEMQVENFLDSSDIHVAYRVTPVFKEDNLVASGVLMEAMSLEDEGEGIKFNVFVYNVQPGIIIDYATGDSCVDEVTREIPTEEITEATTVATTEVTTEAVTESTTVAVSVDTIEETFILNKNTKRFHYPWCKSVKQMKEKNKKEFFGTREQLINKGYKPCGNCHP